MYTSPALRFFTKISLIFNPNFRKITFHDKINTPFLSFSLSRDSFLSRNNRLEICPNTPSLHTPPARIRANEKHVETHTRGASDTWWEGCTFCTCTRRMYYGVTTGWPKAFRRGCWLGDDRNSIERRQLRRELGSRRELPIRNSIILNYNRV